MWIGQPNWCIHCKYYKPQRNSIVTWPYWWIEKTYFSPRARSYIYTSISKPHFSRQPNPEKGRVFKIRFFLHDFAAANARAELSCKLNAIKLAWIAETQPIMTIKAQKLLAQGKRSDTLGQRHVS